MDSGTRVGQQEERWGLRLVGKHDCNGDSVISSIPSKMKKSDKKALKMMRKLVSEKEHDGSGISGPWGATSAGDIRD